MFKYKIILIVTVITKIKYYTMVTIILICLKASKCIKMKDK